VFIADKQLKGNEKSEVFEKVEGYKIRKFKVAPNGYMLWTQKVKQRVRIHWSGDHDCIARIQILQKKKYLLAI